MLFVQEPNLPENKVSLVVVDGRAEFAIGELNQLGIATLRMRPHSGLYDAVCCHPDMLLHPIGGDLIVYAPETDRRLLDELRSYGFRLIQGASSLSPVYPRDIAYNVARVGKWYFHNLKYTDPIIKEHLEKQGIEPVDIKQGYAKCSILPISESSIITTDAGIAKTAEKKGLEVLLLKNEKSIHLPGLNHGFIGGACSMISKTVCAINGRLENLYSHEILSSYLKVRNIQLKEISNGFVTDIGSIFPLMISERSN